MKLAVLFTTLAALCASALGADKKARDTKQPSTKEPSAPARKSTPLRSFEEYKKSADEGDAAAQAVVAFSFQGGWPVEQNFAQANAYAEKSAAQGNPLGLARLGYQRRVFPIVDLENAFLNLIRQSYAGITELAVESGDPHALATIARIHLDLNPDEFKYISNSEGRFPSRKVAIVCMRAAADMGLAPAQHRIAVWAREGFLMPADESLFRAYAKKAADQNYKPSIALLEFAGRFDSNTLARIGAREPKITNVSSIFTLLPNIIRDWTLVERLALAPIDATVNQVMYDQREPTSPKFEHFPTTIERIQHSKADYITYLSQFDRGRLSSIRRIKQEDPIRFSKITQVPKLDYISPDVRRQIAGEIADENSQCVLHAGGDPEWISFASGLILVNRTEDDNEDDIEAEPAEFIPSSIIAKVKSISVAGDNMRVSDGDWLEGVEKVHIHCWDGAEFIMPFHSSLTSFAHRDPSRSAHDHLAQAFDEHNKLHNLSILQKFTDAIAHKPNRDTPGLLGYSGIRIGMPQQECLDVLRDSVDYLAFHPVETLNCLDAKEMDNIGDDGKLDLNFAGRERSIALLGLEMDHDDGKDAINYLRDLQIASNGLTLVPPWTIATIRPTITDDDSDYTKPTDVFVFKENRLVAIGRYPNTKTRGRRMGYPEPHKGQRVPHDHSHLNAMLKKYGEPFHLSGLFRDDIAPATFQLIWADEAPVRVGGVFNRNGCAFVPFPHLGEVVERVRKFNNTTFVHQRGQLIPIHQGELPDLSKTQGGTSSLSCAYYWDADSAELLDKTSAAYMAVLIDKQKQDEKQAEQSKMKKLNDEL